jgi:hypothetical protein
VTGERIAGAVRDGRYRLAPLPRQLALRDQDLSHECIVHQGYEISFCVDVMIEAHCARPEASRDAPHRNGLEALGIRD